MGTSNWQNIPYCIEILRDIEPKSILDVGIGFGRWGILIREFLEVWYDRDNPSVWQLQVEGIEVFKDAISDYHHTFYDRIHIGDAFDILPTLKNFDLIILGDVIEHFTPERAGVVIKKCKEIGKHVMLNIPLGKDWQQTEKYGNQYEMHLSIWADKQLTTPDLIKKCLFKDFSGRPFGVYLYQGSKNPPKLRKSKNAIKLSEDEQQAAKYLFNYFLRHPRRTKIIRAILGIIHKWIP